MSEHAGQKVPPVQPPVKVLQWIGDAQRGYLRVLDQTHLPASERYVDCRDTQAIWGAIRRMVVRGAPAIGVAAGYGMVVAAEWIPDGADFLLGLEAAAEYLSGARPTAVNLAWGSRRVLARARAGEGGFDAIRDAMLQEARAIHAEDEALGLAIGRHAAELVGRCTGVLTHCNAGALATAGIGTATAGMYLAHAAGKRFTVYCDETRPVLQGARLTAWELTKAGIDTVVIADSMAGWVMKEGRVQMVITGADRIAANGDVANKIGSYGLAVLAARHKIPFYVAAPYSTFDLTLPDGSGIPIEQRPAEEITHVFGQPIAPAEAGVYNPAFDVTPAELVTAIFTDCGVIQPVNRDTVAKVIARSCPSAP
ncbi:MAG: S-methyl-5-thioribose-1-phosphate isomerase [Phycisphaerae bacterium]|nr:S-methyl-5-thioribose-1-phosphate isomerase [Phycisphaerae bacterium]